MWTSRSTPTRSLGKHCRRSTRTQDSSIRTGLRRRRHPQRHPKARFRQLRELSAKSAGDRVRTWSKRRSIDQRPNPRSFPAARRQTTSRTQKTTATATITANGPPQSSTVSMRKRPRKRRPGDHNCPRNGPSSSRPSGSASLRCGKSSSQTSRSRKPLRVGARRSRS